MKNKKRSLITIAIMCFLLNACSDKRYDEISTIDSVDDIKIDISYSLPKDLRVGATQEELAIFAWEAFFALNWKSSYRNDNKRTTPDKTWKFTGHTQPDLAVWETYIHRTELRPANGKRTADLTSGMPHYRFIDSERINLDGVSHEGKSLDSYWNILDEDNEIGSSYLFAHKNEYEVLYSAKTNLAEYNYVKDKFPTDSLLNKASAKGSKMGLSYFKGLSKEQMCAPVKDLIRLPCGGKGGAEGRLSKYDHYATLVFTGFWLTLPLKNSCRFLRIV